MRKNAVMMLAILAALLAVPGCSGTKVTTAFNREYDFNGLRTYAWLAREPEVLRDPLVDTITLERHIKGAVESELSLKGYTQAEADPDFYITYHFGTESQVDVSACGYHYPDSPRCWGEEVETYTYNKDTLILDFIDPDDLELVWRGYATETIYDTERMDKTIGNAVHRVLAKFPPKT
jgi:hypothetical protein